MTDIAENIEKIKERIAQASRRVNRDPSEIILLAATKDVPAELISKAIEAGITDIGENKVQEARPKYEALASKYPNLIWHMIGHLQTNKVKKTLEIFSKVQSVDSLRLAQEIDKRAREASKKVDVLVEVNTSGEATKFGVKPEEALELIKCISGLPNIKVTGLMTIGPLVEDTEKARPSFKMLRNLRGEITKANIPNVEMKHLSMGMTDDFEVAIEEGSNIVRIGRAIFGIEHKH